MEQLTSLSLRGDATLQEYMTHLKVRPHVVCCLRSCSPCRLLTELPPSKHAKLCQHHQHTHGGCLNLTLLRPQSLSAQLRSRELSLADAESQLAAKDEALAAAGQEMANMHKALAALDRQRDELASHLDAAREEHSSLAQATDMTRRGADDLTR